MSRLSITTRSVQCIRLSPEGDDIGAYFHFSRQISFSENAVDKSEETKRDRIRRGCKRFPTFALSAFPFLRFIAFVHVHLFTVLLLAVPLARFLSEISTIRQRSI